MNDDNNKILSGGGPEPNDGPGETFPHPLPGIVPGAVPPPTSSGGDSSGTGSNDSGNPRFPHGDPGGPAARPPSGLPPIGQSNDGSSSGFVAGPNASLGTSNDLSLGSFGANTTGSIREGSGGAPASLGNAYSPMATPPGSSTLPNSDPSQWYIGPEHRGPSPPLRIGGSYGTDGLPSIGGTSGGGSGIVAGPNAAAPQNSGGGSTISMAPDSSGQGSRIAPGLVPPGTQIPPRMDPYNVGPIGPPDQLPGNDHPTGPGGTALGIHPMPAERMPGGSPTAMGGGLLNPIDPIDMHHPQEGGRTNSGSEFGGGPASTGLPGSQGAAGTSFGSEGAVADGNLFSGGVHRAV